LMHITLKHWYTYYYSCLAHTGSLMCEWWAAAIGQHLVKLKEIILLICTFVQWLQSNNFIFTKVLNSAVGAKDIKNTQIPCDLHKELQRSASWLCWQVLFLFLLRDGPFYWADFILFS
jgi:hypothetical protein